MLDVRDAPLLARRPGQLLVRGRHALKQRARRGEERGESRDPVHQSGWRLLCTPGCNHRGRGLPNLACVCALKRNDARENVGHPKAVEKVYIQTAIGAKSGLLVDVKSQERDTRGSSIDKFKTETGGKNTTGEDQIKRNK